MATDSRINRFVARGTTAQRTAFVPNPAVVTPLQGYLWWDTDLQTEFAYDFLSSAWVSTAGGSATGTVTHTATLTANRMLKGNGGVDITVGDLSGDVTTSGTMATTIAAAAVTNAKSANMAAATIKGRASGAGTGAPTDLTGTQATVILDAVVGDSGSGGTKGLVPAPSAGDAAAGKFLKANGAWSTPAGGGNVSTGVTMTSGKLVVGAGGSSVAVGDLTGDVTTSGGVATTLANTAVVAGSYRRVNVTVDAKGRITAISANPLTNTVASSGTPAINTDTTDDFTITALAVSITSFTSGLTGTPRNGQTLTIRILDNGTARAITWGASFASRGGTLPTTTVAGKYLYVGLKYNSTAAKWDCVGTAQEA